MAEKSGRFQVVVPIVAPGIKSLKEGRPLKVVAFFRSGEASCV
jgi:hypothetical protein